MLRVICLELANQGANWSAAVSPLPDESRGDPCCDDGHSEHEYKSRI
jgi:hypothetical protein